MPGAAGAVSGKPAGFSWISLFAVEAFRYLFDLVVEVIPLGAELLEDIPQRLLAHVVLQEVVGEELDDCVLMLLYIVKRLGVLFWVGCRVYPLDGPLLEIGRAHV